MRFSVLCLVTAVVLLAGCGGSSVPSPAQSPQPSPSAAGLRLFHDPLGGYALSYDAHELAPGAADPTAADYWGRRSSDVTFHVSADSGLDRASFVIVTAQDAKGELTAAEAGAFWAKQFRAYVRVERHSGATFSQPPRVRRSGDVTVYTLEMRKGSAPIVSTYRVVKGTRIVILATWVSLRSDYERMQALSAEMTTSLSLR